MRTASNNLCYKNNISNKYKHLVGNSLVSEWRSFIVKKVLKLKAL